MGFEIDPEKIERLKKQLRDKIISEPGIPEEIKMDKLLDFDIPAKVELSDEQMAVAIKLLKGFYKEKSKELQKDLDLINRNLAWTIMLGGDFSGLDLHGVDFSISDLSNAKFKDCNLSNCKMTFSLLSGSDFSGARLDGAEATMILAINTKFSGCSATGANLSLSDLSRSDFSSAFLSLCNMNNSNIRSSRFIGANLSGADLSNCSLDNSEFAGAVLTGVSIEGSSITGTIFEIQQEKLKKQGVRYGMSERGEYKEKSTGEYLGGTKNVYASSGSHYIKKKGKYG